MGWWIKEHIAVNEDETKQLCSIEADNQTSLPAADQSAAAGFIIVRGSAALVLDTGESYIMNSVGTWVQQPSGVQLDLSGYATTQDLTDGLAEKVDTTTYTAGQAAQDEEIGVLANAGSKNVVPVTATSDTLAGVEYTVNADGTVEATRVSSSSSSAWFRLNTSVSLKAGTYILSGGKSTAERVLLSPTASLSDAIADSQGSEVSFTLSQDTDNLIYAIRIAYTDSPSNVKFSPMIRRAEITDNSFQPYAPTNRELYEMILALQ